MLRSTERDDVFFDSVVCLSPEVSVPANEGSKIGKLDYEIWRSEPKSIKERREIFLREMGLVESVPESYLSFERITSCSGTVSSSSASPSTGEDQNWDFSDREAAASTVDEAEQNELGRATGGSIERETDFSPYVQEIVNKKVEFGEEGSKITYTVEKKMKSWWKKFQKRRKGRTWKPVTEMLSYAHMPGTHRMMVQQRKKRCSEFSAVYMGQEIQAHKGLIRIMKFSPDGQYLATGGEDGVARIWGVTSVNGSNKRLTDRMNSSTKLGDGKFMFGRKSSSPGSVVIPDKLFQIKEIPVHEFYGHAGAILDLAWSKSNYLLSSSMDKTVRLWQVGCDECLNLYHHNDYVTCVQFNPVCNNYFISGSVDGKVRIWGEPEGRVVDWADVRDIVTAICYHPDGKGFIVGSISGTCRFYKASGSNLQLISEMHILGRKSTSTNKITGIQFTMGDSQKILITSEDSKVRVFDGIDVVHKFKGFPGSGSQRSASFTSSGRHMITVGEDSRVYIWNCDTFRSPRAKQTPKSTQSCEHFLSEGVSVAAPWPAMEAEFRSSSPGGGPHSHRFTLGGWFSMDAPPSRGFATWPEEKLPVARERRSSVEEGKVKGLLEAWGLVIVTAGWDGTIRTFQNYGLPVRL